ncbi:MAG: methyl-accepting chemotaxis protein, partial [Halopseudomonas sp.]
MQLKTKLSLLLLVPLLALALISGQSVIDSMTQAQQATAVKRSVELSVQISNLVHQTQKERGASAIFLSSQGSRYGSELSAQSQQTDLQRQALLQTLAQLDRQSYPANFLKRLGSAETQLKRLDQVRQQVSSQSIKLADALAYYTAMNGLFLDSVAQTLEVSPNADEAAAIMAYANFLKAKERAGIERAVLSAVFTADRFSGALYPKFIALVSEQQLLLAGFEALAVPELIDAYQAATRSASFSQVAEIRSIAMGKAESGGFGVDASTWFDTITVKINALKALEDQVAAALIASASEALHQADQRALVISVMTVAMLLVISLAGFLLFRHIFNDIQNLIRHLMEIAEGEGDLTQRLTVKRDDELGSLARWFNTFLDKLHPIISDLVTHVGHVQSAASDGSHISIQTNEKIQQHQLEVDQVVTAITELSAAAQEVAGNTSQAAEAARHANTSALKGKDLVKQS